MSSSPAFSYSRTLFLGSPVDPSVDPGSGLPDARPQGRVRPAWTRWALRLGVASLWLCCATAQAEVEAIWHCSRQASAPVEAAAQVQDEDEFRLSSLDVIGVRLEDLLRVYSGRRVRIGTLPLAGCFMPGDDPLSVNAQRTLGIKTFVLQKLATQSTIVESPLYVVHDESEMLQCMERHFPAFGYLSKETITERVAPCF